jgi:hypothetical protein
MTKKTQVVNNEVIEASVTAVMCQVTSLREQRIGWQSNAFATANDGLYNLLTEVYAVYDLMKDATKESKQKRIALKEMCSALSITFRAKKPHLIDLLTKVVFSQGRAIDASRISSYARVLKIAALSPEVDCAADLTDFIKKSGGVEEVRRQLNKRNSMSVAERVIAVKKSYSDLAGGHTINYSEVSDSAAELEGNYVVLVGKVNAQGEIEVKHMCAEIAYGERNKNFGSSVVNKALTHMYDLNSESITDEAAQPKCVTSTASSNDSHYQQEQDVNAQILSVA